jgi:hypothetical protein
MMLHMDVFHQELSCFPDRMPPFFYELDKQFPLDQLADKLEDDFGREAACQKWKPGGLFPSPACGRRETKGYPSAALFLPVMFQTGDCLNKPRRMTSRESSKIWPDFPRVQCSPRPIACQAG